MMVPERFREIATMKCLGAMDGFILKAFRSTSSVGLVGSFLGAILGLWSFSYNPQSAFRWLTVVIATYLIGATRSSR